MINWTEKQFSLRAVVAMGVVWLVFTALNTPFFSEWFRPNLGGGIGFPLNYYEWRDFGPPFQVFHWFNLLVDIILGVGAVALTGWIEKKRGSRKGGRTTPPTVT